MRGHLFPAVAILEELRRRGHEIAICALSCEVPTLRRLGFDARPLSTPVEALAMDDWRAQTPLGAARRATRVFRERAALDGPELSRVLREVRPDALLVDIACWGALGAAEAWGRWWAAFCPFPLPIPAADVPAFGPGFPPARRLPGRLRDGLGWAFVERSFDRIALGQLNQVRSALGASAFEHAHELFTRPPLLLYMTTDAFEYPRAEWPANVEFVGPCSWDPPRRLSPRLASTAGPLVLVTTSSDFQDDGRLVRVALEALAGQPCDVVATMPANAGLSDLRPPPNATVEPFVPHGPLLGRASCAITHGGMGVTQKALAHGVPTCVVPFGRDQFEVARRVEVAGAGTRLPSWRLTPERLRRKVEETMTMAGGAQRVAESFAACGGATAAADRFERL